MRRQITGLYVALLMLATTVAAAACEQPSTAFISQCTSNMRDPGWLSNNLDSDEAIAGVRARAAAVRSECDAQRVSYDHLIALYRSCIRELREHDPANESGWLHTSTSPSTEHEVKPARQRGEGDAPKSLYPQR